MTPQRYSAVPQNDTDEAIILSPINTPSYNYNSGMPNSVSSVAPSIPSSPPPSFHSSQSLDQPLHPPSSPGTPRPTFVPVLRGGDHNPENQNQNPFQGLWNGGNSSNGGDSTVVSSSASDATLAITLLRSRVDRLEESLGRLLLAKESSSFSSTSDERSKGSCCVTIRGKDEHLQHALRHSANCCVAFSDIDVDLERGGGIMRGRKSALRFWVVFLLACGFLVLGIVAVGTIILIENVG